MTRLQRTAVLGIILSLAASTGWSANGKVSSDLTLPVKRQETVDRALRLTKPPVPAPVRPNMTQPFNPNGFDLPDDSQPAVGTRPASPGNPQPTAPAGNRELLESIAARIQPTGSLVVAGRPPVLSFAGAKRVQVGNVISVTYNDRDYDLEVVAITTTNFTLRYRGEEITRPIAKSSK